MKLKVTEVKKIPLTQLLNKPESFTGKRSTVVGILFGVDMAAICVDDITDIRYNLDGCRILLGDEGDREQFHMHFAYSEEL